MISLGASVYLFGDSHDQRRSTVVYQISTPVDCWQLVRIAMSLLDGWLGHFPLVSPVRGLSPAEIVECLEMGTGR